jgi:GNAT superfamily N-acetyltransferase
MGSCFYHPREHHVSLGIMNVHPNYFGRGVGRALVDYIIEYTERGGFRALRLIQSALNLDSFSLYNRAGFVARCAYQDMVIAVPSVGMKASVPGVECVRDAAPGDVEAMAALELEISGIARRQDYRYAMANQLGIWHVAVYESPQGRIDGFLISSGHTAVNIVGPGVARSEREATALVLRGLDRYRGRTPVTLVPVECETLVRQMYKWGARNCELHFGQVRGAFQPFRGVNLPAFLPETG